MTDSVKNRLRKARARALASLSDMTNEALRSVMHEIRRDIDHHAKCIGELKIRHETIKMEWERRHTSTPAGFHITDHAVVRYLQRVKGIDVDAARAEIGEMARRAKQVRANGNGNGRRIDLENGLTIGVNENEGVVTTVYADEEVDVLTVE